MFFPNVVRLPVEALSKLASLQAQIVSPGDVYFIPETLARYWQSVKERPAVVLRVQRSPTGVATVAYLVYGSTQRVPPGRAFPVEAGEAGLPEDTNFDLGPSLELPTTDLVDKCEKIGSLSVEKIEKLEAALASSRLPFRSLPK